MRNTEKRGIARRRARYEMWTDRRSRGERWRPVVDYEGLYSVSSHGRVRSERNTTRSRKGAIIQPGDTHGYRLVALSAPGYARKTWLVHRLVAEAFIGLPPCDGAQTNHRDGNRSDNRVENLEWVTPRENREHGYEVLGHARPFRGEANPQGKLTEEAARKILRLWNNDREKALREMGHKRRLPPDHVLSLAGLARRFGVKLRAVWRLVHGETWQHLRIGVRRRAGAS